MRATIIAQYNYSINNTEENKINSYHQNEFIKKCNLVQFDEHGVFIKTFAENNEDLTKTVNDLLAIKGLILIDLKVEVNYNLFCKSVRSSRPTEQPTHTIL